MHVASSERIFFFTYHRWQELFLDKFPLQEFFLGIVTLPPVISNGPSLTDANK